MTTADDSLDEKCGLEFIDMFNSMIETCERMKATIKRIQGLSNADAKKRIDQEIRKTPSASTCSSN